MERKKISQRTKEKSLTKVLLVFFIFLVISMAFYIKILGSTNIGHLVEKDGYCKLKYGKEWSFNEKEIYCYKGFNNVDKIKPLNFTEKEFRNFCQQNKFFSKQFYSNCFNSGDARI